MRFVYALIALGLVAGVPTKTNAQTWDEYRPAGIGFRIEMPGKPQLETQKTKAGNTAYQAIVGFRDMAFLAIYGTKDEKSPADTNALLDAVVKGMTEGKKIVRSKAEMLGDYPARRILIEDGDKDKIEARIVFADNRLIQALFVGPAGNQLGRRFLDSFAIVDPN